MRISEIIKEELGEVNYVDLSGPSHAEEVARKLPTAVTAAGENIANAKFVQQALMNNNFRIYTSKDVRGLELGGAIKNVFAIAAGSVVIRDVPADTLVAGNPARVIRKFHLFDQTQIDLKRHKAPSVKCALVVKIPSMQE